MPTNKPTPPKVHLFDGWAYFANFMLLVFAFVTYTNVEPYGDLPARNWRWLAAAVVLVWGMTIGRYIQIKRRVEPKWNYPTVIPWSKPLHWVNDERPLDMTMWFAVSAEHSFEHAQELLQDAAMLHRVEDEYFVYVKEFRSAYGR